MKKIQRIGVYGVAVKDSRILLVKKTEGCFLGLHDLPGGGIEFGETTEEALKREFLEEVGMQFQSMHFIDNLSHVTEALQYDPPFHFHQLGQIYRVEGLSNHPQRQQTDPFDWHPIAALSLSALTPFAKIIVEQLQVKATIVDNDEYLKL